MNSIEIIQTVVPHSLEDISRTAETIAPFAQTIHIDIDDGAFAPHITWPYTGAGTYGDVVLPRMSASAEMHLMIEEPRELGVQLVRAGAARIIAHVEGFADDKEIFHALESWKRAGAEVGLAMLLATPLEVIEPYVAQCNVVHLMTIATIGMQGIPYDPSAPARIAEFHQRFPDTLISVDGGVSEKNITDLARAGARRFGVGSAIMKAEDPAAAYNSLKSKAENAIE